MSIIFEKLKSLKGKIYSPEQKTPLAQAHNIYTFKKLIFSTKGGLLIITSITVFGFISFLSLSILKGMLDTGSSKAIIVKSSQPVQDSALLDPDLVDPDLMEENDTGEESSQDDSYNEPEEEFNIPEFFIQPEDETESLPAKKIQTPEKAQKSVYELLDKNQKKYTHLSPDKNMDQNSKDRVYQVPTKGGTTMIPDILSDPRVVKADPEPDEEQGLKEKSKQQQIRAEQERKRWAKEKKSKKNSQIAELSAALETAIQKNDSVETDQILEQLYKKADINSSYYLKLMAFQNIRKKNYTQAKFLLQKVLNHDDQDLEAGLNMAIIEIREEKFADAKKRLVRLKEIYPFHTLIEQMLGEL